MHSYEDFPPYPYFYSVLKSHPKAAWLYIQLWQARDEESKVRCSLGDVRDLFLISPTIFRNQLMDLVALGILSVINRKNNHIEVELVDFDQEEFDSIEAS
jgi:hypothetical protein